MSIEADLFSTLGPLVGNRAYPETYIQPNGNLPEWPAIRYSFISSVPMITICGDSGDDAPDTRVQIDCTAKTFMGSRALRLLAMSVMQGFFPPAILQEGVSGGAGYDAETKTFRASLDYVIYKSSVAGSP